MHFSDKACKKKSKTEHRHRILYFRNKVGAKFQLKLTILNFWAKLIQKGYVQSKKEKMKMTIEFHIFELV